MLRSLLLSVLLLFSASSASTHLQAETVDEIVARRQKTKLSLDESAEFSKSGLELSDPTKLGVLVEIVGKSSATLDLSEATLQSICASRLKDAGVTAVNREQDRNTDAFLYAVIHLYGDAFDCSLQFKRPIFFQARGNTYRALGTTWQESSTGVTGGNGNVILSKFTEQLESFAQDFLSNNEIQ